jgi:hypothetical protein
VQRPIASLHLQWLCCLAACVNVCSVKRRGRRLPSCPRWVHFHVERWTHARAMSPICRLCCVLYPPRDAPVAPPSPGPRSAWQSPAAPRRIPAAIAPAVFHCTVGTWVTVTITLYKQPVYCNMHVYQSSTIKSSLAYKWTLQADSLWIAIQCIAAGANWLIPIAHFARSLWWREWLKRFTIGAESMPTGPCAVHSCRPRSSSSPPDRRHGERTSRHGLGL